MKTKTKLAVISFLLFLLISLPIQFYLSYQILSRIEATELMWFLWLVQLPVVFLAGILTKIMEGMSDK